MLQIQSTYFSVHFQYAFLKYVAYLQSTYLKEKICIGYVLKSAEVRTLILKIHPTHTHTYPSKPMHTHIHIPEHTNTYLQTNETKIINQEILEKHC